MSQTSAESREEAMVDKKFLIVDDSAAMRQLLITAIKKLDAIKQLTVVEAMDGQDALRKFQDDLFDIVITDVKMPNMDGLSFIEKIRRELGNRTIPIVIISTKGDESDIERGIRAGANAYLLKPVSIIRLREIVTKLVDLQ